MDTLEVCVSGTEPTSALTHLFLKSSTRSCMFLSSESRRPRSPTMLSSCLLRLLMYCSKRGSRFCLTVFVPCSWSRVHLVSRTLFCCSRKRTWRNTSGYLPDKGRKILDTRVARSPSRPVWPPQGWAATEQVQQFMLRSYSPKLFFLTLHTSPHEVPLWSLRCSHPVSYGAYQ